MSSDVPCHAFDSLSQIEHLSDFGILGGFAKVFAPLDGFFERRFSVFGNHFADFRDPVQRDIDRAPHILDRTSCFECAEGSDLSDVVLPVFIFDVSNDLAASVLAKIDIDIRCFESALIEEPLEEQVVFDGANV